MSYTEKHREEVHLISNILPTQSCVVTVCGGQVVAEGAGGQQGGEVIQPAHGGAGVCHDCVGDYSVAKGNIFCNDSLKWHCFTIFQNTSFCSFITGSE